MNYIDFLKTKIEVAAESGFEAAPEDVHPALKPHQRAAVIWACKGGRRALFERFGLGKTVQELEFCRLCAEREDNVLFAYNGDKLVGFFDMGAIDLCYISGGGK